MRRTSLPSYLSTIEPFVDLLPPPSKLLDSMRQNRDKLRNTRAYKLLRIHQLEAELISENCELKTIESNLASIETSIYTIETSKSNFTF